MSCRKAGFPVGLIWVGISNASCVPYSTVLSRGFPAGAAGKSQIFLQNSRGFPIVPIYSRGFPAGAAGKSQTFLQNSRGFPIVPYLVEDSCKMLRNVSNVRHFIGVFLIIFCRDPRLICLWNIIFAGILDQGKLPVLKMACFFRFRFAGVRNRGPDPPPQTGG